MNIKKGLTYVAFGFLFTLVNLNLNWEGGSLNVMPDFIGWILLFLATGCLGTYMEQKMYLKWISLVMIILSGAVWVLGVAGLDDRIGVLKTVAGIVSAVFMLLFFGVLEEIARDYGSQRESTLRMLKYINFALCMVLTVLGFTIREVNTTLALAVTALGACALVAAVVTAVVLFGLRKEISARAEGKD